MINKEAIQGGEAMGLWEYYYKTGDKPDPIVTYIVLGVLVLLLAVIGIYNHIQDKKKRGG